MCYIMTNIQHSKILIESHWNKIKLIVFREMTKYFSKKQFEMHLVITAINIGSIAIVKCLLCFNNYCSPSLTNAAFNEVSSPQIGALLYINLNICDVCPNCNASSWIFQSGSNILWTCPLSLVWICCLKTIA